MYSISESYRLKGIDKSALIIFLKNTLLVYSIMKSTFEKALNVSVKSTKIISEPSLILNVPTLTSSKKVARISYNVVSTFYRQFH